MAAATALLLATPWVDAQEVARFGVPRTVDVPPVLSGGTGLSWDGRVALVELPYWGHWGAVAIRTSPTAMPTDPDGFPRFTVAPGSPTTVSPGLMFAGMAAVWNNPQSPPNSQTVTQIAEHTWGGCNMIPDPAYTGGANPYRSLPDGTPSLTGGSLTYRAWVITDQLQYVWSTIESKWVREMQTNMPLRHTGRVSLRITVGNPDTNAAEVTAVQVLQPFAGFFDATGQAIRGLEPTVVLDGHMIIVQASKTVPNGAGELLAYVNPVAGAVTGWLGPVWLHELHGVQWLPVAGRTLGERYPFVRQPIKLCDGTTLPTTTPYTGGYPWISWDGRFVMHTTTSAGVPNDHPSFPPNTAYGDLSNRGGVVVVGSLTGGQMWHIDGPTNPNRYGWTLQLYTPPSGSPYTINPTARQRLQCFGFAPGFWNFYRENGAFPARPDHDFAYFPFVPRTGTLSEMSFEAWTDQDYTVFLAMNEMLMRQATGSQWVVDPTRTPDTSGHGNNGVLQGAAKFPCEQFGLVNPMSYWPPNTRPPVQAYVEDRLHGKIGQAIYFGASAVVRVNLNSVGSSDDLSGQLWVRLETKPDGAVRIAQHPGRFEVALEGDQTPRVSVHAGGQWHDAVGTSPLQIGVWYHLGFSFEDRIPGANPAGELVLYVDGDKSASVVTGTPLSLPSADLDIGPGSSWTEIEPLMLIDQFALSRVVRDPAHFRAAAYTPLPTPSLSTSLPKLPGGLVAADAQVPASNPFTVAADKLGEVIFFDKNLSASQSMSCATCHVPDMDFTDGLAQAIGHTGATLRRNTPTILNRLFSSEQFWDGRSPTLEAQSFLPFLDPLEMGMPNEAAVLSYLQSDPNGYGYGTMFQAAFGSATATRARVERALASYMRNALRGDSPEDLFAGGNPSALSSAALAGRELFFGQARCSGCHNGSNFTDERRWNTGLGLTQDSGAFEVTGLSRHLGAFKTPTLRNVANTAPYFHDGSAATLLDVVEFYDRGGIRLPVPFGQTVVGGLKAPDTNRPLGLTSTQKKDLVEYLHALTGIGGPTNH